MKRMERNEKEEDNMNKKGNNRMIERKGNNRMIERKSVK